MRLQWRRAIAIYEILTFVATGWNVVRTLAQAPARVPAIYIVSVLALAGAAVSLVAGLWLCRRGRPWSGGHRPGPSSTETSAHRGATATIPSSHAALRSRTFAAPTAIPRCPSQPALCNRGRRVSRSCAAAGCFDFGESDSSGRTSSSPARVSRNCHRTRRGPGSHRQR